MPCGCGPGVKSPARRGIPPWMVAPANAPSATCRAGGEDDREYMVGLAESTFVDLGDYRAIIAQWLDAPRVQSVLVFEAGVPRGFALVAQHRGLGFFRSSWGELVAITLEPGVRGRGLGSLLLREAEDMARTWAAQELRLHTAAENTAAQSFFAAAGYGVREGRVTYYPNGQPAIEFRRLLDGPPVEPGP